MKLFIILLTLSIFLQANEYFSKAQPLWEYHIKSAVRGQILFSDKLKEGKYGDGSLVIKVDDKIDLINLKTTKTEYENLKEMIKISQKIYNLYSISYNKIKNLSTYSRNQKDAKLVKMLSSKNTLLTQQTNLAKLELKLETLQDKIDKKNIKISNKYYIQKIYPKKGDFVNFGSPLLDIADLSYAKLTIFVTAEDLKKLKNSDIIINGKKQKYKILEVLKTTDSKNISGYKVQLEIEAPKIFSKLVKVEIR